MSPDLDLMMRGMPEEWRKRWCEGAICACLGCANNSGGLTRAGFSKAEWEAWLKRNSPNST